MLQITKELLILILISYSIVIIYELKGKQLLIKLGEKMKCLCKTIENIKHNKGW